MAERTVFADAGRRGAAKRWGPPRHLNLGDLDADTRRLILSFVDMARATEARTNKAVAVSDDASDGPSEVTHAGVDSDS